jgi:arylformamidase
MLANDWARVAGVPADLVRAGYGLSGVYDLAPLIDTSLNEALHEQRHCPCRQPRVRPARPRRRFIAAVGGDESAEFLRQNRVIAETWEQAGLLTENEVVPGTNHFTVVEELIRPSSPMLTRIIALAREVDGG